MMKKIGFIITFIFFIFQSIAFAKPTKEEREQWEIFGRKQDQINDITYKAFRDSKNKKETFELLKKVFQDCQKNAQDPDYQKICDWKVKHGFGEQDQFSTISFEEVWNDLITETDNRSIPEQERSIFSGNKELEHYPFGDLHSLEFPDTYTVNLQPYLESGKFYYTVGYSRDGGPNELGILVIRPEDTHRQSLVKVASKVSDIGLWGREELLLNKGILKIILRENIIKDESTGEKDTFFFTYALQKDKSRKRESCEKTVGENGDKRIKVSKKQCLPLSKHFIFTTSLD